MPSESLGGVADIVMGQSPPGDLVTADPDGLPLLNGPTEFGPHHPAPVQFTTEARKRAARGDLLFCVRGSTTGRMNWADREYAIGRGIAAIRHKQDERVQPFVRAVVEFGLPDLLAQATGSTFPNVSAAQLAAVPYPNIDLGEQRAIASLLGALDDKIEQNRRTARALERLALAIFQAWFVDFEPVEAKAGGAIAFQSMPQSVFEALPTRFTDSDIGRVPERWQVKAIAKIATFLNGLALQKYPPRGDGHDLRIIKIAQLRKGSTEGADWANGDVPEQYVIRDRELLFSWSGTLEAKFWFGGPGALNQHLFKVTSERYPIWFCRFWIRHHLAWFRSIAASKATTMGHIKRGHLQEAKVVVPPVPVLQAADGVLSALYDLNAALTIESRRLGAMRKLLIPKLLSGVVRVNTERGSDEG